MILAGIHSNRGSMVGNDRLMFNFSNPSASENKDGNRPVSGWSSSNFKTFGQFDAS